MDAAADPAYVLAGRRSRALADGLTVGATVLGILCLAVLPLLSPWAMHAALDAAQSAAWLGTDAATAHALSDRTVDELVFGTGTFAITGPAGSPFYSAAEIAHLNDARTVLWLFIAAGTLAMLAVGVAVVRSDAPGPIVRAVGIGGAATAIGVVVIGAVGLVAFDPLFELFHRVFFPAGNWAFDARTDHLVQLYPYAFWQVMASALGVIAAILGILVWLVVRVVAGTPDGRPR